MRQSTTNPSFHSEFLSQHPVADSVMELFEFLPSVFFYAKDAKHRYIAVNQTTLNEVFGFSDPSDLLGKTDSEFQPPALAEAYHSEDRRVMEDGKTIPSQVWLVPHVRGTPHWYVSTKTPLRNLDGEVIGIAGVMYPIETPEEQETSFQELLPVIRHIDQHYCGKISMTGMAKMAGLFDNPVQQSFSPNPADVTFRLRSFSPHPACSALANRVILRTS